MSELAISGSVLGTPLKDMLLADSIQPGSDTSYQLCKAIYTYHPLGAKMAEQPTKIAQSQGRELAIPLGPEDKLREAFQRQWVSDGHDRNILNVAALSRVYGISSLALMVKGQPLDQPVDYSKLWQSEISFNTLDPLNTAGSLVLNQDPNAMDFQHVIDIVVQGKRYHRSRIRTMMNERPIYIEYTSSAFGYVGRSVYQRPLFPLKTFVQTMVTDDMVARKAGLLVVMMQQAGSIISNLMATVGAIKRNLLKQAATDNVLEIGQDDKIESINLQNLEAPATMARKNSIENVATGAGMPAKLLLQESFAEGFGEGTEDAKYIAQFIDEHRKELQPLYAFLDEITMWRAWNPEFYRTIQKEFPEEYGSVDYKTAFYTWKNSFAAQWPSLITEPDSEKIKVDDVKLKAVIALVQVLMPQMDPENKTALIAWACDNFNQLKLMFGSPLNLDYEALEAYTPPTAAQEPGDPKPFATSDAALKDLTASVSMLPMLPKRPARQLSAS